MEILFYTLKLKAAGFYEEFVAIYQTTRCHIPEDRNINRENKCTCMLQRNIETIQEDEKQITKHNKLSDSEVVSIFFIVGCMLICMIFSLLCECFNVVICNKDKFVSVTILFCCAPWT